MMTTDTTPSVDIVSGLLTLAGCHSIVHSENTGHVNCSCPFAPHRHRSGQDENPSFSVSLEAPFLALCFTCKASAPLANLMLELSRLDHNGRLYNMASALLNDIGLVEIQTMIGKIEVREAQARQWVASGGKEQVKRRYVIFDESELASFSGAVPRYAITRGIDIATAKKWSLGYDRHPDHPRLVFPVRDLDGNLVGLQGRRILDETPRKYYNYWNFSKGEFLYGAHLITSFNSVVVVEGMIDTIRLNSYGIPTVGIMGCKLTDRQTELLSEFKKVTLAFDGDAEGLRGSLDATDRLKGRVLLFQMQIENGKDPKDYSKGEAIRLAEDAVLIL